jgi:hypothetical protein
MSAVCLASKFLPESPAHHKMTVRQNISAQKNTTPMGPKLDESVEIRPKSPDVSLETGVDVSVVRNKYSLLDTYDGLYLPEPLRCLFNKSSNSELLRGGNSGFRPVE